MANIKDPKVKISIPLLDCKSKDEPTINAEFTTAMETMLTIFSSLFENLFSSFISNSFFLDLKKFD